MKLKKFNLKFIFSYLKGRLTVRAEGPFTERLINICMHRGLTVDNIKNRGKNLVIFTTDISSYKQMRDPSKRTKTHTKIIKKQGFPFWLKHFRKRKAVCIGFTVAVILLFYCSSHVMGITIYGNNRISKQDILSNLEDYGIKVGTKTKNINPDYIRNSMINSINDLVWIGINANGSHLYIEVVERIEKEKGIIKDDVPCNLVAEKDGIILDTTVRLGQTLVTKGSGVIKGDVLVSGVVDNTDSGFEFLHARGEIYAETRYTKTKSYPMTYSEKVYTGKIDKKRSISVLNHTLHLYLKEQPSFENFSEESDDLELRLPFDILPSVFIHSKNYSEYYLETFSRTANDTVNYGTEELTCNLKEEIPDDAEIKSINESHTLTEHNEVEITVEIICRENIAVPSVIETSI